MSATFAEMKANSAAVFEMLSGFGHFHSEENEEDREFWNVRLRNPKSYDQNLMASLYPIVKQVSAKYMPAFSAMYAYLDAKVQLAKLRAEESQSDEDWQWFYHIAGCSDWWDAFKDELLRPTGRELAERGIYVDRDTLIDLLSMIRREQET